MKFILSHNDMDGYGCILSGKKAFGDDLRYMNVNYGDILDSLQYITNEMQSVDIDTFYVTDLNFREIETIELYKMVKHFPNTHFVYVDHHPYETEKQRNIFKKMKEFENFEFVHTENYCATWIFYKYLIKKGELEDSEAYHKIMELIDAYDTWKDDKSIFKPAMALNDIFYHWQPQKFMNELMKSEKITDDMKHEMKTLTVRKNTWFKELESKGFIQPLGDSLLFLSDDFVAHMTVDYPGYNYYVNGRSYGKISVRVNGEIPSEDAKALKLHLESKMLMTPYVESLGGHDHAFGVTLSKEHKDKMLLVVEMVMKEIQTFTKVK